MKRIIVLVLTLLIFFSNYIFVLANDDEELYITDDLVLQQLENIDTEALEDIIGKINMETEDFLPALDIRAMTLSLLKGEQTLTFQGTVNGLFKYLFREVVVNFSLLAKLMILSILCAFLNNLSNAFESEAVGKLAYIVCYLVIIAIAVQSFSVATKIGLNAINDMVNFMQALLPILLTFLMATGGITTTALFQPIIIGSVGIISTLTKDIIVPIIFFSAILSIINHMTDKIQISKLALLLKQICILLMGLTLTVFTGIITIQGVAASTADGVAIRTAKFAVDKFIPIVGGFLTEAVDTIMGCSLLLKNGIGALGLIALAFIVVMPLLKILSLILIYKIASAIIEPIIDGQLSNCLKEMSNSLTMLFAAVLTVAIMFFIAVTIIVGAGNITLMMR
ncbi:MAG: stage III sporulation protein AE [Alkaliphilus sp.]|nr:stage III sporulation protein AE [Alkaliphilus sp.]